MTPVAAWDARLHGEDSPHPAPFFRPVSENPGPRDRDVWQACFVENEYGLPYLDQRDVVLDIGMHIGAFACLAYARGSRRVAGYEPDAGACNLARKNCAAFGAEIDTWNLAVVGNEGPFALHVVPGSMQTNVQNEGNPVRTIAFDAIVKELDRPIRFAKFDCEGAEWEILRSSRVLDRVSEIAGEYHEREGERIELLAAYLSERWGFQVGWSPSGGSLGLFRAVAG